MSDARVGGDGSCKSAAKRRVLSRDISLSSAVKLLSERAECIGTASVAQTAVSANLQTNKRKETERDFQGRITNTGNEDPSK